MHVRLHSSPYSLNCHEGAMVVIHKLCRIARSSRVHKTESVSVQSAAVSYMLSVQKWQTFSTISCRSGAM